MNEFPKQPLKKINPAFDKISLLFQAVLESEARSLLPAVQLDFSWTIQMSDRQNDRFTTQGRLMVASVPCDMRKESFEDTFFEMNKFPKNP